nr:uncharacterized protein LOC105344551 isoform X2 [Crassostrea gigas]
MKIAEVNAPRLDLSEFEDFELLQIVKSRLSCNAIERKQRTRIILGSKECSRDVISEETTSTLTSLTRDVLSNGTETSTTINSMESTNDKFSKMAVTTTPVLSPSSVTRGHTPHDISTHGDPTFPITTPVSINNASTSITDSSATLIRTRATSTLTSTVSEGHMISRITPLNVTPTSLISENVSSTTNTDKSFDKVQEAYGLSVTAVVAIIAVCVGWGIKWALKRFNVQCRLPVTCNGRNQGVDPPGIELRQVRVNMDEEEEEEEGDDQDTTSEKKSCPEVCSADTLNLNLMKKKKINS